MASIELLDVHLTLSGGSGPVNILQGVDLNLNPGEQVSVAGPSGSGKTTLLMVIAGLERPTSGLVRVDGVDLGTLDEDGLARFRLGRVGIVFQGFHLLPTLTALENVALPLELAGAEDAEETARVRLEDVGLGQRSGHYPAQLSGGEQQRVALARAFAPGPKLLMADEPTGNLDARTGEAVMELIFEWQERSGATVLLITHDPKLAARADRRLGMRDGRIYGEQA